MKLSRVRACILSVVSFLIVFVLVMPGLPSVSAAPQQVDYTIAAVGDIAGRHLPGNNPQRHQYDDVADLIEEINPVAFLALGDLEHENGLLQDYLTYYDSPFGKLREITYPVPGNHDYYWDGWPAGNWHSASNGSGYFGYFDTRLAEISADPNTLLYGYYSFDLDSAWHLVALNSVLVFDYDYTVQGTPANIQYQWLEQDLKDHSGFKGTIVYFHHPLYDWETPNSPQWFSPELRPIWDLLYANHVEIVLDGHSHTYQRWGPQDAYGNFKADGVREFIVGTGGYYMNNLGHPPQPANFVTGQDYSFGVLKLTLHDGSYDIAFVSTSGALLDSEMNIKCN